MLETEEEIVYVLEEIDNTFSSINRTLRSIKGCIEKLWEGNQSIIEDLNPWVKFFEAETDFTEIDTSVCGATSSKSAEDFAVQDVSRMQESPLIMRFSSPKNPFVDNTSSEILNRTFLGELDRRFEHNEAVDSVSSSCTPVIQKNGLESCEGSDSSDIVPFDANMVPAAFQKEQYLFPVYKFISQNSSVTIEEVYREFHILPKEKLNIFIDLLLRKRFVTKKKERLMIISI